MIEQVRKYQKLGLHVYPLVPGTKIPFKGSNGFYDGTNDLQQLNKWWIDNPKANIGLYLEPSRLMVIDVDRHEKETDGVENIKQVWNRFGSFPPTYIEKTPRNGVHFFFKLPDGVEMEQQQDAFSALLGKEKTGIDVITHGIPIAPTTTPHGIYSALDGKSIEQVATAPNWLVQALQGNVKSAEIANYPKQARTTGKKYTGAFLDELVHGAPKGEGSRNDWIMRQTSKMLAVGADLDTIYQLLLVVNDNFMEKPLKISEINATFKSRVKKHTKGGH